MARLIELVQATATPSDDSELMGLLAKIEGLERECEAILSDDRSDSTAIRIAREVHTLASVHLASYEPAEAALARLERVTPIVEPIAKAVPDAYGAWTAEQLRQALALGRIDAVKQIADARITICSASAVYYPIVLMLRGTVERARGEYSAALSSLALAESLLRDRDPSNPEYRHIDTRRAIAGERGQLYLDVGRLDLASAQLDIESALIDESTDLWSRFAAGLHRIHLAIAREDDFNAKRQIEEMRDPALPIAILGPVVGASLDIRLAQIEARAALDDPEAISGARAAVKAAMGWLDVERILTLEDVILTLLTAARVELLADDIPTARSYLETALQKLEEGAGSAAVSKPQIAALATELASRQATGPDDPQLRTAVQSLRSEITRMLAEWAAAPRLPAGIGFFHFADRAELIASAIRAEARIDPSPAGLERMVELVLAVDANSRLSDGRSTTLSELRSHVLQPGERLCIFAPSPSATQLLIVSQESIARFELRGARALRRLSRELDEALDTGADLSEISRTAYVAFFPAVCRPLLDGAKFMTCYGIESLGAPAVEAFGMGDDEWLGARMAISRTPSLAWLARRARQPEPIRSRSLVLITAPKMVAEVAARFETIDRDDARADQICARYDGSELLVGSEATLEKLLTPSPPSILQFFVHGDLDPRDPRPARLLIAPSSQLQSGMLTCEMAERIPSAELVILGACRSGVGPLRRGDAGSADLSGAFLHGGARAVIAVGSDVRAGPASRLLVEFHRAIGNGMGPSEALTQARRRLLEDESEYALSDRVQVAARFRIDGLAHSPLRSLAQDSVRDSSRESRVGSRDRVTLWTLTVLALAALLLSFRFAAKRRSRATR